MDSIARLPATDRADLFVAIGTGLAMTSEMIEKDFWVCWTLKRLFTLPDLPAELLFKGGTSLSKVFKIIERFSEDVDLSFNRVGLGFEGMNDPVNIAARKGHEKKVKKLTETCRGVIRERFLPRLRAVFSDALGEPPLVTWGLDLADDDPDNQTLLFRYPADIRSAHQPPHIKPVVRLEIGARSEHWPVVEGTVSPYAADYFPSKFKEPTCKVRALAAGQTFWEKATVLHALYYYPADKKLREGRSRHYYDVVRLYEHELGKTAVRNIDLLTKVVGHKKVFFPAAWARYEEAKPGTLRLVPPDARRTELQQDYRKMQEMIFGERLEFEHLLEVLAEIEREVNRG